LIRLPGWKEIVAKPIVGQPGAQFHYGPYHLCAFAEALQRRLKSKTGETFEKYMERRILRRLALNWSGESVAQMATLKLAVVAQ